MIELHRLSGKTPRRVVVLKFALVCGSFIVLAGAGVGLAWLQSDASQSAESTQQTAKQSSPDTLATDGTQRERITDGEPPTPEAAAVQSAATTTASTSSNVVRPTAATTLIAEHRALFEQAFQLLSAYEAHIASGTQSRYVEATNMKGALDLAISKTTAASIGSDSRAAYESSIMLSISNTSTLLSDAASLYANSLFEYVNGVGGAGQKLLLGQQKAASAKAAFEAIP